MLRTLSRALGLITLLTLALPGRASAAPCGGKNQRACCVGEGRACDKGFHEEPGCRGDCKCGNSVFSSAGRCRADKKADSSPLERPGIEPCGGPDQRACCVGERNGPSCNDGLREVVGCKGDCRCGGVSLADSSGTCRRVAPCGGKGQRACCVGERAGGACDPGLAEKDGCKGNCLCGGASLVESSGTCQPAVACGGVGQRACCAGEREGTSCDAGLIEIPGCQGDCRCGAGVAKASASGTCQVPPTVALIQLERQAELVRILGQQTVDKIVAAVSKQVLNPMNADKWPKLAAATTSRLPLVAAIASRTEPFLTKVTQDTRAVAPGLMELGDIMKDITRDKKRQQLLGILLVGAAEGRFDDPKVQEAAGFFAKITKAAFAKTAARATERPKDRSKASAKGVTAGEALEAAAPYLPKSFGVSLGWSAGAHVGIAGGFAGGFGFVADCDVTQKLYDIRATFSISEGVGVGARAAAFDLGVAALYHVFPVPARNIPGGSFGAAGGGGAFVTANAEVIWGFITKPEPEPGDVPQKDWLGGMPVDGGYSVIVPMPSFGVGLGLQLDPGAGVLFNLGWTATFGRPGTGGMCDASGCWDLALPTKL